MLTFTTYAQAPGTEWRLSPSPQPADQAMWIGEDGIPGQLSDYRGNVILLNIWATWCQPCLAEMPTLDKLQRRYKAAGLTVMPVALDPSGFAKMDGFYRQAGIHNLPLAADPSGHLLGTYATRSVPTTYIIDRQGNLFGTVVGTEDWFSPNVQQLVEQLLRQETLEDLTAEPAVIEEVTPMILDVQP